MREKARPHRLHREDAAGTGQRDELARLRGVDREGLLDQHGLAGLQGERRVGQMHRVRRGHVDGVDVGILDEGFVARVALGDTEALREGIGGLLPARADRDDAARVRALEIGGERRRDASGPDQPPAKLAFHGGKISRLAKRSAATWASGPMWARSPSPNIVGAYVVPDLEARCEEQTISPSAGFACGSSSRSVLDLPMPSRAPSRARAANAISEPRSAARRRADGPLAITSAPRSRTRERRSADTQAWQRRARGFGARARMHGHVLDAQRECLRRSPETRGGAGAYNTSVRSMKGRGVAILAAGLGLLAPLLFRGQDVTHHSAAQARSQSGRATPRQHSRQFQPGADSGDRERSFESPGFRPGEGKFPRLQQKVLQTITTFAMDDEPIAAGLVFDTSGSMGDNLQRSRMAAAVFFKIADPDDEFFWWSSTASQAGGG